jgi:Bacterial Ig-like domain (group 3)/NHL repeat
VGFASDSAGDLFIVDGGNNVVREVVKATGDVVTVAGDVVTVAGDGKAGHEGDGGPATAAELDSPNSVAVDSAGDLFISDAGNNRIRAVVAATGDIITVAGNGTAGYSGDGGPATAAEIASPRGLAVDSEGDVFFADNPNNVIREVVAATGDIIITVAGDGTAGYSGGNGPATATELNDPGRLAIDPAGDLFIADRDNNVVRELGVPVTVTISPAPTLPGGGGGGGGGGEGGGGKGGGSAGNGGSAGGGEGGPVTPIPAVSPRVITRTVLAVQPRPARVGQPVALVATVKLMGGSRAAPGGSVTFLDGTTDLGTVLLRRGKARLVTWGLVPGRNKIQVQYDPGPGTVPSGATLIETVRLPRSRSKVVASPEVSHPESWCH